MASPSFNETPTLNHSCDLKDLNEFKNLPVQGFIISCVLQRIHTIDDAWRVNLENVGEFKFEILTRLLHDFAFYIAEERTPDETEGDKKDGDEQEVQIDTFQVIGIRRSPGECLVCPFFATYIKVQLF